MALSQAADMLETDTETHHLYGLSWFGGHPFLSTWTVTYSVLTRSLCKTFKAQGHGLCSAAVGGRKQLSGICWIANAWVAGRSHAQCPTLSAFQGTGYGHILNSFLSMVVLGDVALGYF